MAVNLWFMHHADANLFSQMLLWFDHLTLNLGNIIFGIYVVSKKMCAKQHVHVVKSCAVGFC